MFEMFASDDDAIVILKKDHDKVKSIFDDFKNAATLHDKKRLAAQAILELKLHAEVEEKIFYPAVRRLTDDKGIMNEADEEHHVAKLLIAELDQMDGTEEHWEAKFTVLSENIRHHIREEEGIMMPQARGLDIDFVQVGKEMLGMKQQMKKNGLPKGDEARLMAGTGGMADSPAKAAAKTKAPVKMKAKPAMKVKPGTSKSKVAMLLAARKPAKKPVSHKKMISHKSSRPAAKRRHA